jgi:hypothetical protein
MMGVDDKAMVVDAAIGVLGSGVVDMETVDTPADAAVFGSDMVDLDMVDPDMVNFGLFCFGMVD